MITESKRLLDSCTLVADCIINIPDYGNNGNILIYSYSYNVPIEQIEEAKRLIVETYKSLGQTCSRVYISGFSLLTSSFILTRERLIERIRNDVERVENSLSAAQAVKMKK